MKTLTARQEHALTENIAALKRDHGVDIRSRFDFALHFRDEVRPGRGHDITYTYADSDHVVTGGMDPYGSGYEAVGEVDWIHNSSDDECACEPCERFGRE